VGVLDRARLEPVPADDFIARPVQVCDHGEMASICAILEQGSSKGRNASVIRRLQRLVGHCVLFPDLQCERESDCEESDEYRNREENPENREAAL
jgi:hypothetical protein